MSSVFLTGKWEWTTSSANGRWSKPQQVVKPLRASEVGQDALSSKLKMRGQGKSLVLSYESSERLEPFHILGYSVPYTAGSVQ